MSVIILSTEYLLVKKYKNVYTGAMSPNTINTILNAEYNVYA